jgi:hypothetical protein
MPEELVHRITGASGRYRADVLSRTVGVFHVEINQWHQECPEWGREWESWERVSNGFTFADTLERAVDLAREELAQWDDVPDEPSPE